MSGTVLRLSPEELSCALDSVDPAEVLAEELVGWAAGGVAHEPPARLTPWHGGSGSCGLVLLADPATGGRCLLPVAALVACRTAALVALAASALAGPGVVTAAVLGSGCQAVSSLGLLARRMPGLSHVAICPSEDVVRPVPPKLIDQLDLAGIGWSLTPAVADAVFGATLVVSTSASGRRLEIGQLPKGAVLVNATGADLPNELVDGVDQVYVDDAALIGDNRHRYFARMYMAGPDTGPARLSRVGCGRYRPIEADLAQLLTGGHAGRTHVDHILLVELLGTSVLDIALACMLHRAALEHGLGAPIECRLRNGESHSPAAE